jgi:hypothetical protein
MIKLPFFYSIQGAKYYLFLLLMIGLVSFARSESDHNKKESKSSLESIVGSPDNLKDIVINKTPQSTLYLLSGWEKKDEPYVWFTVSAHFSEDQLAPNNQRFNLFSASGAQDCRENKYFYYRASYMHHDTSTKDLKEIFLKKNKSELIDINPAAIEGYIKKIICQ